MPSLWTYVSTDQPSSAIKNVLSKSKDALLDIVYYPIPWMPKSRWPARMEVNDLFMTIAHRWRSFKYEGHSEPTMMDVAFVDLHHLTVPSLNSISFYSSREMSIKLPSTTRLRHISLAMCSAPWDSGQFSGLKTLRLYDLGTRGPSIDQFINFLRASPGLVTLTLKNFELQGALSNPAEIITLQSLEAFDMIYMTGHIIEDLLANLRIPNCTKLLLKNDHLPDSKLFGSSMEHLFPTIRAIMASCDYINLRFEITDVIISSVKDFEEILAVRWSTTLMLQDLPIDTCEGLRNLIGSCPTEKLTLQQQIPDASASKKLGQVLEFLSTPRDIDGITQWPLPNLNILKIVQDEWTEQKQLVNMLCNRYGDHKPRDTNEPPPKLWTLTIATSSWINSSNRKIMEDILGQGVMRYIRKGAYW
ncbi:hypothetical protein FRB95_003104 [Tulasnella sp. JGI-2019a]|nr:hypothetical protein FRB95_003104 [Tulasnella sp. JGI-2019a]